MIRLFRKNIDRHCAYCSHGTLLNEDTVLCSKRGLRSSNAKCRKFTYDPCKRTPAKAKALDFEKYDQYDYSL